MQVANPPQSSPLSGTSSLSTSTIKGKIATPPRRRPHPEMQHMGLDPNSTLEGCMPPTHKPSDSAGHGPGDEREKTMTKSKRLEPCGRCQVMTAVRVALPCRRLVNLCIPCASTFARFLSKRIRDLARDTLSDKNGFGKQMAHGAGPESGDAGAKGRSNKFRPPGLKHAKELEDRRFSNDSPLGMASDQLQDRALDKDTASKVLGRSGKGYIPDNQLGGLSPTFRARKSSPPRKFGSAPTSERVTSRTQMMQKEVHLSQAVASPMIVADSNSPSPFGTPLASALASSPSRENEQHREWGSASLGASRQSQTLHHEGGHAGTPGSRSQEHGSIWRAPEPGRERRVAGNALMDAAPRGIKHSHQRIGGGRESWEGDKTREKLVLPHGRTVAQTNLSEHKNALNFFPDLKGARTPEISSRMNVENGLHSTLTTHSPNVSIKMHVRLLKLGRRRRRRRLRGITAHLEHIRRVYNCY
jgi:hypothetical protein